MNAIGDAWKFSMDLPRRLTVADWKSFFYRAMCNTFHATKAQAKQILLSS